MGPRPPRAPDEQVTDQRVRVDGRDCWYGVGGQGLPVVFLHGWGLGHRSYRKAIHGLIARNCRVYAPSLPGFGGTTALRRERCSLDGYAEWVHQFLAAIGVDEPALVVGHSFGGGVGITLAHAHPERVRYLVLLNSVGGPSWVVGRSRVRQLADRPLWDWMAHFMRDLSPLRGGPQLVRAVTPDLTRNMLTSPFALYSVSELARRADLTGQLAELGRRGLPVLVLSSERDGVIPHASFDALRSAIGAEGHLVDGGHSWLLADPGSFGEVLENVVQIQVEDHRVQTEQSAASQLGQLLRATTIPRRVITHLLKGVPPLWVMSEPPAVLAGDLALCYPRLGPDEVRAVARPLEDGRWRLTVVAHDRPGLLADTAGVLVDAGLSVSSASAGTWGATGLAVHALTVDATKGTDEATWAELGRGLRAMAGAQSERRPFRPLGRATVSLEGAGPGRVMVRIIAPDQVGLLEAICRWCADRELSIEAANVATNAGVARDTFIVDGELEPERLARYLSRDRKAVAPARRVWSVPLRACATPAPVSSPA